MKRFWLGVVLLLGLPALGFGAWAAVDGVHTPVSAGLETAAEEALTGDWGTAVFTAREARDRWEDARTVAAALCDHTTLEEIDGLFARMEAYARSRARGDFAAACMELARLTRTPAEGQRLSWWNLM